MKQKNVKCQLPDYGINLDDKVITQLWVGSDLSKELKDRFL